MCRPYHKTRIIKLTQGIFQCLLPGGPAAGNCVLSINEDATIGKLLGGITGCSAKFPWVSWGLAAPAPWPMGEYAGGDLGRWWGSCFPLGMLVQIRTSTCSLSASSGGSQPGGNRRPSARNPPKPTAAGLSTQREGA